ncbi:MAG: putative hemin transporter permease protein [Acidobacteriota bacterium]|jgi:iron complex transport system permease protein
MKRDNHKTAPAESAEVEASSPRDHLTRRRTLLILGGLGALVTVVAIGALGVGSERIGMGQIAGAMQAQLLGSPSGLSPELETILFGLRLPRIGLAVGVGAALALAGTAFQAILRNPLADPYVLGISGGAALGSIIAIMVFPSAPRSQTLGGLLGALVAMSIVYQLGRREEDPAHLVLAGIVISTLLSSVIVLLMALADTLQLRRITLWLLGDLSTGTAGGAIFVITSVLISGAVLTAHSRALNLMMIGEADAEALGVETARVRWVVYLAASVLTAAAVAAGGAIGYVGLVVPHLIRLGAGADNRLVIPASALGGALLVLVADAIARTVIAPRELPTGAIIALIGAPTFLYLLVRRRRPGA